MNGDRVDGPSHWLSLNTFDLTAEYGIRSLLEERWLRKRIDPRRQRKQPPTFQLLESAQLSLSGCAAELVFAWFAVAKAREFVAALHITFPGRRDRLGSS